MAQVAVGELGVAMVVVGTVVELVVVVAVIVISSNDGISNY